MTARLLEKVRCYHGATPCIQSEQSAGGGWGSCGVTVRMSGSIIDVKIKKSYKARGRTYEISGDRHEETSPF